MAEIVETIDGRVITEASDLPGNPTCRLSRQGNPQLLERISAAHETGMTFQFVENEGVKFSVLGQNVDLPRRVIELVGVRPHILEKALSSPSNDSFTVEWIPTEQFRMRYRFISDNDSFLADNE